jgi:RNA polymerase sigma-70 factor (ECF subfamily)
MARAQAGDAEAYRRLLDDVSGELRGFFRRRAREPHEVEDLLQETLLTLHRARHTYDPARPFEPWLYALARNAAISAFRRDRARSRWESLATDDRPLEGAAENAGREASLEGVLTRIPDSQREALEMVKLKGMTIEDAAARAGVSPGAMRVRIHRGYRALRALLLGKDG